MVASDSAGLGTDGLPAYLNGRSEAHNVVDMVKAGRAYAQARLGAGEQLSNRWVVIGQSQGGGAAIYTARYATEFGGDGLRYTGAVGTGVPAYIEHSKQASGKTRTMLRAGPFADRAAASAAIAKVREAGLTANAGNAAQ